MVWVVLHGKKSVLLLSLFWVAVSLASPSALFLLASPNWECTNCCLMQVNAATEWHASTDLGYNSMSDVCRLYDDDTTELLQPATATTKTDYKRYKLINRFDKSMDWKMTAYLLLFLSLSAVAWDSLEVVISPPLSFFALSLCELEDAYRHFFFS